MNIRKYWKRILFSATALFWASCGGDSENSPFIPYNNGNETPSSSSAENTTSSSVNNLASSAEIQESSSSETPLSSSQTLSSSSIEQSSSSFNATLTHKLASDTTVKCYGEQMGYHKPDCFLPGNNSYKNKSTIVSDLKDLLENNKTRTLEELNALEDSLEAIHEFEDAPVYGVSYCVRYTWLIPYHCSDGNQYSVHIPDDNPTIVKHNTLPADEYMQEDNTIYSWKEYKEKYLSSSSESSSSSTVPSPLCTKNNFANIFDIQKTFNKTRTDLTDSTISTLSEEELKAKKNCLNKIWPLELRSSIATKQICDGDTIVNPRYQAKLDSNTEYIQKQIDECMKEE